MAQICVNHGATDFRDSQLTIENAPRLPESVEWLPSRKFNKRYEAHSHPNVNRTGWLGSFGSVPPPLPSFPVSQASQISICQELSSGEGGPKTNMNIFNLEP